MQIYSVGAVVDLYLAVEGYSRQRHSNQIMGGLKRCEQVLLLPRTVCSFGNDFIALEMKESLLTFHDDNFCKFHVLYACEGDACALKTRGRFLTERGKKKKKKKAEI